jgi:alpha-tubulin suppressor-like RCC1 family protein
MASKLKNCDNSIEAICAALREDAIENIEYDYLGSALVKVKGNQQLKLNTSTIIDTLHQYSSALPGTSPHVYRLAEELRRWALDQQSSRLVMFRGMSGSGKSESFRTMLQHFIYTDAMHSGLGGISEERDPSKPLGFYANPMIISSDASTTVKKFYASLCLMQAFSSAATEKSPWSTRIGQYVQLHFSSQGRILDAVTIPVFTEMLRCNPKDPNVGPLYIQHLLVHSRGKPEYLCLNSSFRDVYTHYRDISYDAELMHLHNILIQWGGFHEDQWENLLKVVASVVHLQNINILGSESAMISANTKHHVQTAEQLLGVESGSLMQCIMKKVDDRPSRPAGSTMECRPHEAKIILDLLCNELMVRALTSSLDHLRTNHTANMVTFFEEKATQDGSLHIFDPSGWERYLPQTPGNFYQYLNHYIEEKFNTFAIQEQFLGEIYAYQDEGIHLDQIAQPNITQYVDLLEQSPGGLISLLEDACSAPKPDDKTFADKAIMNFGRVKLVRAGGAKTKPTTFVVRHSFAEVSYDCDGFIFCNKLSEPSPVITNCLKSSSLPLLVSSSQFAPLLSPPAPPPPPKEGTTSRLTKAKITLLYTKFLQMTDKFLAYLASCEKKNFVLCVNASTAVDDALLAGQTQTLLIPNLVELCKFGFGYRLQFVEFFQRYRILARFEHSLLPIALNPSVIHDANLMKSYGQALMEEVTAIIAKMGMIDMDLANAGEGLAVYGRTSIFIKDSFAELMERARFTYFERYTTGAVRLQSFMRMKHWRREFVAARKGIVILQSCCRSRRQRKQYLVAFHAAMLLKGWFLTRRAARKYQRMKTAVCLIKSKLLGKMVQRIRYQRLIRAARNFQLLARGSLLRRAALNVFDAVILLQRTFRALLMRRRHRRQRKEAILRIQRVFRGHRARGKLGNLVQVLKIRREQRIANQVVQKLQSIWRGKLVIARFQELVAATIVLQRWFKACIHYRRFQKVRALAIWLQSQARRLIASKRTNVIKVGNMVREEKGTLTSLYLQEISSIRCSQDTILTYGFTNHGRDRFERDLIMYDVSFDLSIAYPDGWLPTILSFVQELRVNEKRSIQHLVVGAQHTVLVDDFFQVYTMGLGDIGQLGHNSRKSYSSPKKIEQLQRFITTGETLDKLKAGTLSASKLPTQVASKIGILSVACGQDHTLLLTQAKKVFSWGDNRRGQLGHSNFEVSTIPRLVTYTHSVNKQQVPLLNVKTILCGKYHSACLAENGLVYVWGAGEVCMGIDRSIVLDNWEHVDLYAVIETYYKDINCRYDPAGLSGSGPHHVIDFCEPRSVSVLNKRKIFTLVSGEMHIAVIANDGVYTWGNNAYGQLGLGHTKDTYTVSKVTFSHSHSHLGATSTTANKNALAQSQMQRKTGKEFSERDLMLAELMTGGRHMFLRTKSGSLWGWGWNKYGQVGDGSLENILRPLQIAIKDKAPAFHVGNNISHNAAAPPAGGTAASGNAALLTVALALGWRSTMAITKQGHVYGWGIMSSLAAAVEINASRQARDVQYEDPSALFLTPTLLPIACSSEQTHALINKHTSGNGLHCTAGFALSMFMLDRVLSRDNVSSSSHGDDDRSISQHSVVSGTASSLSASLVAAPGKVKRSLGVVESKAHDTDLKDAGKKTLHHRTVKLDIMRAAKAAQDRKERENNIRYDTKTGSQKNNTKVADEVLQRFRHEVGRLSLYPGSTTTNKRNMVSATDSHGLLGATTVGAVNQQHTMQLSTPAVPTGQLSPRVGGGGAIMRNLAMQSSTTATRPQSPGRTYTRGVSPGKLTSHDHSFALFAKEDVVSGQASVGADSHSAGMKEEEKKRCILQEQQERLEQPGALLDLFSPAHYSKIKQRRKVRGGAQSSAGVGAHVSSLVSFTPSMKHDSDEASIVWGLAPSSAGHGPILRTSSSPPRFTQSLSSMSHHHHVAPLLSLASASHFSPNSSGNANATTRSPLIYLNQRMPSPIGLSQQHGSQQPEPVQRIVAYEIPVTPSSSHHSPSPVKEVSPKPSVSSSSAGARSKNLPTTTQRSDMMFLQSFLQKTATSNTARTLQARGKMQAAASSSSAPHTHKTLSIDAHASPIALAPKPPLVDTPLSPAPSVPIRQGSPASRRLSALTTPLGASPSLRDHPSLLAGVDGFRTGGSMLASSGSAANPGEFRKQMQELGYLKRLDKPRQTTPTGVRSSTR